MRSITDRLDRIESRLHYATTPGIEAIRIRDGENRPLLPSLQAGADQTVIRRIVIVRPAGSPDLDVNGLLPRGNHEHRQPD